MRTEIDLNESEIDLNECKIDLNESEIDLNESKIDLNECEHFSQSELSIYLRLMLYSVNWHLRLI